MWAGGTSRTGFSLFGLDSNAAHTFVSTRAAKVKSEQAREGSAFLQQQGKSRSLGQTPAFGMTIARCFRVLQRSKANRLKPVLLKALHLPTQQFACSENARPACGIKELSAIRRTFV
jgi:hypothetical protein